MRSTLLQPSDFPLFLILVTSTEDRVHVQNMQLHHLEIDIGLPVTIRKITDETGLMVQL